MRTARTGPLVLERGEGVHVYDTEGRPYIEGMAGLWCTALGYSNGELVEAARAQMGKLPFTHLFSGRSHDPAIELAEVLKELMPVPTSKIFFTLVRLGGERHPGQARLVLNNALGPAEEEEDHRPPARLSRRHHRHRLDDRAAGQPHRLGPAARRASSMSAARTSTASPNAGETEAAFSPATGRRARSHDPARGAGDGGRLRRRAGDGRGRRHRPAGGLFRGDPGGAGPLRRALHRRRGDLRLRPSRHLVRQRGAWAFAPTRCPSPRR